MHSIEQLSYSFHESIKHFMQKVLFTLSRTAMKKLLSTATIGDDEAKESKKQLKYRNTNKDQQLWQ